MWGDFGRALGAPVLERALSRDSAAVLRPPRAAEATDLGGKDLGRGERQRPQLL
jgi:hypothetical protein